MTPRFIIHDTSIRAPDGTVREHDDGYHGRGLAISWPGDVVAIDGVLLHETAWLQEHYARIGMPVAQEIVYRLSFDEATFLPKHLLDPFIFDDLANDVRPDKEWYAIVIEMNDKNATLRRAAALGVPFPQTQMFDHVLQLGDLEQYNYPLYLKLAVSFAGLGVWRCNSAEELTVHLKNVPEGLGFQLQQAVEGTFLNVSYYAAGDGTYRRVLCTEQILEGPCHVGNGPSKFQPWTTTDPLAAYMASHGMRGYFAFDVVVLPDGRFLLIECNPRWNGSCYPTEVGKRLNQTNWEARGYKTLRRLDQFDLKGFEYNPSARSGVIVLNLGQLAKFHKVSLMLAGTKEQIAALARRLPEILE